MKDSIDKSMEKELELLVDQVLEADREEKQKRFKDIEATVRGHFSDFYGRLPDALKDAGLPTDQEKLQKALTGAISSWHEGKIKHYSVLENYGLALRKALLTIGFEHDDFHKRLVDILGLPPDKCFSAGLGAITCERIVDKPRSVKLNQKQSPRRR